MGGAGDEEGRRGESEKARLRDCWKLKVGKFEGLRGGE